MYSQIANIIAPILLVAALGYGWAKARFAYDDAFLSQLVMHIGMPCLVLSAIVKSHVPFVDLVQVSQITLVCLALFFLVNGVLLKLMGQSFRTYIGPLSFTNTGNMGIPISLLAFGDKAMVYAIIVSMVATIVQFSLGIAFLGGKKPLATVLKAPVFYATVLAFVLVYFSVPVPEALLTGLDMLGAITIPLMLFSLGLSLSKLKIHSLRLNVALSLLRLVGGFVLGLAVVYCFDLSGMLRGVILIQAVMPSAVACYMLANLYDSQPSEVAALVVVSTLLSFVSLPLFLWYLL